LHFGKRTYQTSRIVSRAHHQVTAVSLPNWRVAVGFDLQRAPVLSGLDHTDYLHVAMPVPMKTCLSMAVHPARHRAILSLTMITRCAPLGAIFKITAATGSAGLK
jgi:hypothetical protein